MIDRLNSQLAGWAALYQFTGFTAYVFHKVDTVVFWKFTHWLARKYRSRVKPLMRKRFKALEKGKAKTWLIYGISEQGNRIGGALRRLFTSPKAQFR